MSTGKETALHDTQHAGSEDRMVVLEEILPYLLNRLTFRMNRLLSRDLRQHGLGLSNWRVLAVLDSARSATVNQLADYAMIEQSTLSRLIMRMEKQKLVKRSRSHPDGRTVIVTMTGEGRDVYAKLRTLSMAHADRVLRSFSRSEQSSLKQAVKRMTANLERYPVVIEGSAKK